MNLKTQMFSKHSPSILLLFSVCFSYLCTSYRKGDWVTGGLLFMIIAPIIIIEICLVFGYYLSEKSELKNLFLTLVSGFTVALLIFTLIYIFKYN